MAIKIGNSIKRTEKKCGKPHFFLSPVCLFHQQPHYLLPRPSGHDFFPACSGCIADFLYSRFCRPASFKELRLPLKESIAVTIFTAVPILLLILPIVRIRTMFSVIMLVLQFLRSRTDLRVNHLALCRHLCHFLQNNRIMYCLTCVFPPGNGP